MATAIARMIFVSFFALVHSDSISIVSTAFSASVEERSIIDVDDQVPDPVCTYSAIVSLDGREYATLSFQCDWVKNATPGTVKVRREWVSLPSTNGMRPLRVEVSGQVTCWEKNCIDFGIKPTNANRVCMYEATCTLGGVRDSDSDFASQTYRFDMSPGKAIARDLQIGGFAITLELAWLGARSDAVDPNVPSTPKPTPKATVLTPKPTPFFTQRPTPIPQQPNPPAPPSPRHQQSFPTPKPAVQSSEIAKTLPAGTSPFDVAPPIPQDTRGMAGSDGDNVSSDQTLLMIVLGIAALLCLCIICVVLAMLFSKKKKKADNKIANTYPDNYTHANVPGFASARVTADSPYVVAGYLRTTSQSTASYSTAGYISGTASLHDASYSTDGYLARPENMPSMMPSGYSSGHASHAPDGYSADGYLTGFGQNPYTSDGYLGSNVQVSCAKPLSSSSGYDSTNVTPSKRDF